VSESDRPFSPSTRKVAVTGLGIVCALGNGVDAVWRAVVSGASGIAKIERIDTSRLSCHYAGEVRELPSPRSRVRGRQDRAMIMALAATEEAVASAALELAAEDPFRVGVALGTSVGGLAAGEQYHWQLLERGRPSTPADLLIYPLYTSADAVSVAFGAKGAKTVISNACAAGANSLGWAADAIRHDRADIMLAGGVDVLDILSLAGFDSLNALDSEPCAPYSRSSGLNIGEGAAMLILEEAEHAARRGATPICYLRSYALTSDAHHATSPDPAGSGAVRAMRQALTTAGLGPADVDYVNGHGTGTPANDSAESRALASLFAGVAEPPVSSSKSQLGHMLGNAGAGEAALCVLALRDQVLPPTINISGPTARPDVVPEASRRAELDVVVSNSFAFGGNNCSLVLSTRPSSATTAPARRRVVITGAGVVSGLGTGRSAFLDAIRDGRSANRTSEAESKLSQTHRSAGADAKACSRLVDPAYARHLDQLSLMTLAASRLAVSDAGLVVGGGDSGRIGMIFGTCTGPLETVSRLTGVIGQHGPDKVSPRLFPNTVMNAAAGHTCLSLKIRGPLSTLATGTVSGLLGIGYAADLIGEGQADVMLAGAADELTPLIHLGYEHLGLLTEDDTRPYRDRAGGFVLGSGAVTVILEDLEHAQARGATVLAEVLGYASTSDAFRVAGNDPSGEALARCQQSAVADAGLRPADIPTVYGDARATRAIDLAEMRAVAATWAPEETQLVNLAAQIGHVHATSPMLSVLAALETVASGWRPGPAADDVRDEIRGYLEPGPDAAGRPVLVNAINWGGTNAGVVLGAPPGGPGAG
jgi:3-oxoacyl-[acyl-carrier-protein] synthase II